MALRYCARETVGRSAAAVVILLVLHTAVNRRPAQRYKTPEARALPIARLVQRDLECKPAAGTAYGREIDHKHDVGSRRYKNLFPSQCGRSAIAVPVIGGPKPDGLWPGYTSQRLPTVVTRNPMFENY